MPTYVLLKGDKLNAHDLGLLKWRKPHHKMEPFLAASSSKLAPV